METETSPQNLTPPTSTATVPPERRGPITSRAPLLLAVTDPEWLPLLVVLLLPALVGLTLNRPDKAAFFAGAAIYVSVLKWLGWVVFGRGSAVRPRFLLFPAEVFAGLAVAAVWFYVRNGIAALWPASYTLVELSVLFGILLILHLLTLTIQGPGLIKAFRTDWRSLGAAALHRLGLYGPFAVMLTLALWTMSSELGVQSTDPMFYAFQSRVYLEEGIPFALPSKGQPLVYPTGYAALNALTAALAPLTVVESLHLQHVLLCILSLSLITATVAALVERPLPLLHSLTLPFLFVFPLYALYPDILYPGTPKQVGPPLFAATCLLPLLAPTQRRYPTLMALVAWAVLPVLSVVLNPACVPYALLASLVGLTLFALRLKGRSGLSPRGVLSAGLLLLFAVGLLVIGQDPYYRRTVTSFYHRGSEKVLTAAPREDVAERPPPLSLAQGWRIATEVAPVFLSFNVSSTNYVPPYDHLTGWTHALPQRALTLLGVALAFIILLSRALARRRGGGWGGPLPLLLLGGVILWFVVKYGSALGGGSLSLEYGATDLLHCYIRYLGVRCELLVLFTWLAAGSAYFYLSARSARSQALATRIAVPLAVLVCGVVPALLWLIPLPLSGPVTIPTSPALRAGEQIIHATPPVQVTADDLKLVAWLDENVPPEKGDIGLAGWTFALKGGEEKHIYPLGGGQALPVYGKHYNYRFFLPLLRPGDFEAYGGTEDPPQPGLDERFDPEWCWQNKVRYFYVPEVAWQDNPGIARAIAEGKLRPLRVEGMSAVYEVVPPSP